MFTTRRITDAAGVGIYLAVVQDTAERDVKKPAAANAGKFVGITQEAQATQNKGVRVKTDGPSFATASGVIAVGDYVNIAGSSGKLASCQTSVAAGLANPASVIYVIGQAISAAAADGDIFEVEIQPVPVPLALS